MGLAGELEFKGTGRFAIRRRLGAGGMGVVYEAWDAERAAVVALKTLRNLDPQSVYRLKNEFRALADLEHPNLVRLGELFCEGDQWFFTMELVDGLELLSHVCPGGATTRDDETGEISADADTIEAWADRADRAGRAPPRLRDRPRFDERRLRSVLGQLAQAVSALHAAGKVHRDIKPSNILVTPEGRTVLLDFGLVTEAMPAGRPLTDAQVVGTAVYMAPEQGASKALGPEADWYSIGVVLYEALTGRPPFVGAPIEVLMNKQRFEPAPPHALRPDVPADLDALCMALLRFDPQARPSGREILARLGVAAPAGDGKSAPSLSSLSQGQPFVGRARELLALRAAFADRLGGGVAVFVHGESGLGKSALVRHFLDRLEADRTGALVLAGRCYERESVPFKAFDGLVDVLSGYLAHLDPVDSALLLPYDTALLARVFPVLRQVGSVARLRPPSHKLPNPQELRARAFAALRELLSRLAEQKPLVLFIDDFHWTDADSLALLGEVLHPPDAPPLLLIATARTPMSALAELPGDVRDLALESLSADEARKLVDLLLARAGAGAGRAATAAHIALEAGGHPLFIHELVRHLALAGAAAPGAVRLDEALWARVVGLETPARRLVEVAAVAGVPVGQRIAAQAAELEPAECARCVGLLRAGNLVRTSGRGSDAIELFHDRVREAVLAHLHEATRRAHHGRLANALEGSGAAAGDPQVLVRHLEAAGETQRAAAQAERAARLASEALAFDQAAELYRTALRLGGPSYDPVEARRLRRLLGEALGNAGRGPESAEAYLLAAEGADAVSRLDCRRLAAQQLLVSGHLERGMEALGAVLAEVGTRLPLSPQRALTSLIWQRTRLRLRGLRFQPREEVDIPPRQLIKLDTFTAVAVGLGMVDPIRGADFEARGLLLALATGERMRVTRSLAVEVGYLSSQGRRTMARTRRLLGLTEHLARSSGDPYLMAVAMYAAGFVSYFGGSFRDAAQQLWDAEVQFRDQIAGRAWELDTLHIFRLLALRHMGAFRDLSRAFEEYARDAARRGDRYAETTLTRAFNVAWLARDAPTEARRDLDRKSWTPPEGGYHVQHWYQLRAQAEIDLYEGAAAATLERTRQGFAALAHSLLLRVQVVRAESRWLRGRLALAARTEPARAEAARMARKLERERMPYATVWAQLLRAGVAAQKSERARAEGLLTAAAEGAHGQHMGLCAAAARLRLGALIGGAKGAELVAQADTWMTHQGIRKPAAMTEIVAPGIFC
ncbi:MAG TPA: AAA family ATPase [Polyangia bacterium]|nr:AAA family ATPase [Polyangia bacterium]